MIEFDPAKDRIPGSPDEYVAWAKIAITFAQSVEELREWWRDEAGVRTRYGLTTEHEADLAEACKSQSSRVVASKSLMTPIGKKRSKPALI